MSRLGFKYVIYITILYILSQVIENIEVENEFSILIVGLVLLLVNLLIKPLLLLLTFPLSMVTFGLFTLVVNAWTIMFADFLVPGFRVNGFLNALIAAILFFITNQLFFKKKNNKHESHKGRTYQF